VVPKQEGEALRQHLLEGRCATLQLVTKVNVQVASSHSYPGRIFPLCYNRNQPVASPGRNTMHELAIAQDMLDIVVTEARERSVSTINLVVGELSSVAEEPIRFCFEVVSKGTLAEGARLALTKVRALLRCKNCSCEFGLESHAGYAPPVEDVMVK